jgi:hypothetical protein
MVHQATSLLNPSASSLAKSVVVLQGTRCAALWPKSLFRFANNFPRARGAR